MSDADVWRHSGGIRLEGEHGYIWTVRDGVGVRFRWSTGFEQGVSDLFGHMDRELRKPP